MRIFGHDVRTIVAVDALPNAVLGGIARICRWYVFECDARRLALGCRERLPGHANNRPEHDSAAVLAKRACAIQGLDGLTLIIRAYDMAEQGVRHSPFAGVALGANRARERAVAVHIAKGLIRAELFMHKPNVIPRNRV